MFTFFAIPLFLYSSAFIQPSLGRLLNCTDNDEKDNVVTINQTSWIACVNGYEDLANCILKVHEDNHIDFVSSDDVGSQYNKTYEKGGKWPYESWASAPLAERKRICAMEHSFFEHNIFPMKERYKNIHRHASICEIPTTGNGKIFGINDINKWYECKDGDFVHTKCELPNLYSYPTCIPKTVATLVIQHIFGESPNAATVCSRVVQLVTSHPAYTYTAHKVKNCFHNDTGDDFYYAFASQIIMQVNEFPFRSYNKRSPDSEEFESQKSMEQPSSEGSQNEQYSGNDEGPHGSFQYPGRHTIDLLDSAELYESKRQSKSESDGSPHVNLLNPGSYPYQYDPSGHFNHMQYHRNKFSEGGHIKPQVQTLVDDNSMESVLDEDVIEPDSAKESIVEHHSRRPYVLNRRILSRPARFAPKVNRKHTHQQQRKFAKRPHISMEPPDNDGYWSTEMYLPSPPPLNVYPRYVNPHPNLGYRNRDSFDESESMEIQAEADSSSEAQQNPSFPADAYGHWKDHPVKINGAESSEVALSDHDTAIHGSYRIPTSAELDQYSSLFHGFSRLFDGILPFLKISARNLRGLAVPSIPQEQNDTGTISGQSVKRRKLVRRKLVRKSLIRRKLQASTSSPIDEDLLSSGENQHAGYAHPWFQWPKSAIDVQHPGIEAPSVEPTDKNDYVTMGNLIIISNIEDSDVGIKKDHSSNILQFPVFSPGTPEPATSSPVDQSIETTEYAENVARNKENQKVSTYIQSPESQMPTEIPRATGISRKKNNDEYYQATHSQEVVSSIDHINNKIEKLGVKEIVSTPDNSVKYYQATGSPEIVSSIMYTDNKIEEHGDEEIFHTEDNSDALSATEPPIRDGTDAKLPLWDEKLDLHPK